jgi:6,7-dimethyl-8-ribityllumazine synthase
MKIAKKLEGKLTAKGLKFGVVVSRFNHFISERLLEGTLDAIRRNGANEDDCTVAMVPGAFEIPLVAKKMAKSGRYDAVICLGCVIRGATPHYAYIAAEVTKGIAMTSLEQEFLSPTEFWSRIRLNKLLRGLGQSGNKGLDAAMSAIEMANLLKRWAKDKRPLGTRRKSRELALQALYQWNITRQDPFLILDQQKANFSPADEDDGFAQQILMGVLEHYNHIDELIEKFSEHWRLDRISIIDRNILRMAIFELLFREDIPPKVTLNEAIDLGKRFGSEDSSAFINGILDRIQKEVVHKPN